MQISDVDSILASTSIQQGSSTLYSVTLKSKSGKKSTLVDHIESRQEARWIVWQIEKRAGLSLNTQVEINNSIYGPPPQPGAALSDGSSFPAGGVRTTGSVRKNWSQAVGAIFFVGWLGFIGFMMLRATRMRGARSSGSAQPFVRTAAIKQASLAEVLTWPQQQQAEELNGAPWSTIATRRKPSQNAQPPGSGVSSQTAIFSNSKTGGAIRATCACVARKPIWNSRFTGGRRLRIRLTSSWPWQNRTRHPGRARSTAWESSRATVSHPSAPTISFSITRGTILTPQRASGPRKD